MPELPEVETIRRQLDKELTGFTIVSAKTDWEKSFRPSFRVVSQAIIGKRIESIDRQAKLLIFNLSGGLALLFHLKLTGRLLVRKPSNPPDEFTRSVFTLRMPNLNSSGPGSSLELRFADARKFGFVKLITDQKEMVDLLQGYGPEPLKDLTLEKFRRIIGGLSRPIKLTLLDQEKISGMGNIYANDALWLAKIKPPRPSNKLTKD